MQKKEISLFSVGTFFLTVSKNFAGGIIQCYRNIRAWNIFMQKEISLISVGTFFSHSAEKFCKGNHSISQNSSVVEKA